MIPASGNAPSPVLRPWSWWLGQAALYGLIALSIFRLPVAPVSLGLADYHGFAGQDGGHHHHHAIGKRGQPFAASDDLFNDKRMFHLHTVAV